MYRLTLSYIEHISVTNAEMKQVWNHQLDLLLAVYIQWSVFIKSILFEKGITRFISALLYTRELPTTNISLHTITATYS